MVIAPDSQYYFSNTSVMPVKVVYKGESWYWGWGAMTMVGQSSSSPINANVGTEKFLFARGGLYGNSSSNYNDAWIELPCLTTKNNLESAVTKTADMTMRVTYTVTDQAE